MSRSPSSEGQEGKKQEGRHLGEVLFTLRALVFCPLATAYETGIKNFYIPREHSAVDEKCSLLLSVSTEFIQQIFTKRTVCILALF